MLLPLLMSRRAGLPEQPPSDRLKAPRVRPSLRPNNVGSRQEQPQAQASAASGTVLRKSDQLLTSPLPIRRWRSEQEPPAPEDGPSQTMTATMPSPEALSST